MARSNRVLIEVVGDETVVYDLDSKKAHCLRPFAALVFSYADGSKTTAEIAELAAYRLGRPVTDAEVCDAVAQLEQHALIETPPVIRHGLTRRDAMRRFAVAAGAATATPLIMSITAPTAQAQQSPVLITTGNCCGDTATSTCVGLNTTCLSNQCCQNIGGPGQCNACKCVEDRDDCSSAQCSQPLNTPACAGEPPCPTVNIGGVPTPACARTSSCRCCYPEPTTAAACCVVFPVGGTVIQC